MEERAKHEDFPAFQGRGWSFGGDVDKRKAVTLDLRWGRVELAEGERDIRQSIAIILGTTPGERVMRPEFGCGIHSMTFEVISSPAVQEIKSLVRDALRRFEARIDVLQVTVDTRDTLNGKLKISVDYRVRTTNQKDNFVYPFYFKEGA